MKNFFKYLKEQTSPPFEVENATVADKIFWFLKVGLLLLIFVDLVFIGPFFLELTISIFSFGYLAIAAFFYRPEFWQKKYISEVKKNSDLKEIYTNHNIELYSSNSKQKDLPQSKIKNINYFYTGPNHLDFPYLSNNGNLRTTTLRTGRIDKAKRKAFTFAFFGYFIPSIFTYIIFFLLGILIFLFGFGDGELDEFRGFEIIILLFGMPLEAVSDNYNFSFLNLGTILPVIMLWRESWNKDLYIKALEQKTIEESETKKIRIKNSTNLWGLKTYYNCEFCSKARFVTSKSCSNCGSSSVYIGKLNDRNTDLFYLYSVFIIWFVYRGADGIYLWLNPPDYSFWNLFEYSASWFLGYNINPLVTALLPSVAVTSITEIILCFVGLIVARYFIIKN